MNDAPDITYESKYRNSPLVYIGVTAILLAGFLAGWAAIALIPSTELVLPLLEIVGLTIVAIIGLSVAASGRHRWRVQGETLHIAETGSLGWLTPPRSFEIPLSAVHALRRVESGFDVLVELETTTGSRHRLMQGYARDNVGVLLPDKNGLNVFSNALRKRILAAGAVQSSFQDGLGFWNRPIGLAILFGFLLLSLCLSALILYGMVTGEHVPQGAAMQGLAFVLLLPFGVAYALYQSLWRRSFVLGLSGLRDKLTSKG